MTRTILLTLTLALTACSDATGPSTLGMALERIQALRETPEPKTKQTPPRAAITARGQALIQMNLDGEDVWPIMQPVQRANTTVIYANSLRQLVYLENSRVTETRGLGRDLLGTRSTGPDPLANLTPPAKWPSQTNRSYRFPGEGPDGTILTVACSLTNSGATTTTIAGTPFATIRFTETCSGDASFTNLYEADARTGRVWKSRQWIGPRIPAMHLDILEPLDP